MIHDCVVVGAGIHGLCTTFWLRELGFRQLVVCERYGPGHDRGSSHGGTRITRSSYDDPAFVALAEEAHREEWPALERTLGRPLRLATPGLFFGPADGRIADYERATRGFAGIEPLPTATARGRFPHLRLHADERALLDHSAAVVLAATTMEALRQHATQTGTTMPWHTAVARIEPTGRGVTVWTDRGPLQARTAVVAAGAWADSLLGDGPALTVLRQHVGYFDVAADAAALAPGRFPVWCRIGREANDFVYGLPDVDGAGLKLARHVTEGPGIDPDQPPPAVPDEDLVALAGRHLVPTIRSLRRREVCLYTMTADHGFRVEATAAAPQVVRLLACSGHAFKFAPVLGRRAAEAVVRALR